MSTASLPDRLLKVTEVAERLSLSRSAIYGLMESGQLGYVKIGKSRRVPLGAIERLVRESSVNVGDTSQANDGCP